MKRTTQPPLPPGDAADLLPPSSSPPVARGPIAKKSPADAAEKTIDFVHEPVVGMPTIESLLPPGAETEPEPLPPVVTSEAQPCFALQNTATLPAQGFAPPKIAACAQAPLRKLSQEEKAQRRLWKNAIVFGFFIVVLIVVFYFLAR